MDAFLNSLTFRSGCFIFRHSFRMGFRCPDPYVASQRKKLTISDAYIVTLYAHKMWSNLLIPTHTNATQRYVLCFRTYFFARLPWIVGARVSRKKTTKLPLFFAGLRSIPGLGAVLSFEDSERKTSNHPEAHRPALS